MLCFGQGQQRQLTALIKHFPVYWDSLVVIVKIISLHEQINIDKNNLFDIDFLIS